MASRVLALALACRALLAAPARADDWLASLPPCSTPAGAPRFELVYPRPGLPALVAAGERLVARVRVPSPLTPPPGVQQSRALAGFHAELRGHAPPLRGFAREPLQVRYPLEVVDVRPDGASTLLYRVAILIPAWAAPGSYDFALSAPGGSGTARSALRVLAPGRPARVAWLDAASRLENASAALLPIDVWVLAPSPAVEGAGVLGPQTGAPAAVSPAAAPVLDPRALSFALRVGAQLWVHGACESVHASFEHEVAAALAPEQRTRLSGDDLDVALAGRAFQPWRESARDFGAPDSVRVVRTGAGVELAVAETFGASAELAFVLDAADAPLAVTAADASFYPAGEIATQRAPATVVRLRVAPGALASITRAARPTPPLELELHAAAHSIRSGQAALFRVQALGLPKLRVAWRLDAQHTAFGPVAVEHRFRPLGRHRVHALAFMPDGRVQRLSAATRVETARASGCAAVCPSGQAALAQSAVAWLWPALLLLQRRRCRKRAAHRVRE